MDEMVGGRTREEWERSASSPYFAAYRGMSDLVAAAFQREALVKALEHCEAAVDSLEEEALGFGHDAASHWPLRNELLEEIRSVLRAARA